MVARLFREVDSAFGRLDVLVNNAGVFRFGAFTEITEESFHIHYNINVLGRFSRYRRRLRGSVPADKSGDWHISIIGSQSSDQ